LEPAAKQVAAKSTPRGRETILFAEDEPGVRQLLVTHLTALGYHVIPATDGLTAIEAARAYSGSIDLLLSDFIMPKMGGRELARELRKTAPDLKTIFISGYFGRDVTESDEEFPQTYFVEKPVSMQHLATVVREVLDGTHGSSAARSPSG
jgi:CheY-like chemotaxis protein